MKVKNQIRDDTFLIRELDTLKVLADQVRLQIFETLLLRPLTIREAAEKLGFAPKKLYYHFSLLEQYGLVRVSATHQVGNLIEKQYAVTASNLAVDPSLLAAGMQDDDTRAWLASRLDVTREDILRSLEANPVDIQGSQSPRYGKLLLARALCRIPEARAEEFRQRLEQLIAEFDAADVQPDHTQEALETYALTVAFYPRHHYRGEEETELPGSEIGV